MKKSKYWQQRFKLVEEASHKEAIKTYKEIEPSFIKAQREINAQIQVWYGRFAENNEMTLAEARKVLNANELKEFRWDVEDFIKYGKENAINQKWMKELENASAKFHITRLEFLLLRNQQTMEVLFGNELDQVDQMARRIISEGYYKSIYEVQKGFGLGFNISGIDDKELNLLVSKPWAGDGKNFSSRIWQRKEQMVNDLQKELTRNLILGKAPDESIKNLERFVDKKIKNTRNAAGRLVMTESAYFHSLSQKKAFDELDVDEYEIVATLDSRTSEICQDMDGKHFPMEDYKAGITAPPFHVYCRSTTVPYFDDEFTLGEERAARDKDEKTFFVPGDMKYKEWRIKVENSEFGYNISNKKGGLAREIVKILPDISEIKTDEDRKKFANKLIENMGVDASKIDISIEPSDDSQGFCQFSDEITDDTLYYGRYVLNRDDKRSIAYKVKTAFHEAFHLRANGLPWDGYSFGQINQKWLSLEETFTESAAHYLMSEYGVESKLAPAYPAFLGKNLPRLKQLDKYAGCNTISDFGKIALEDRLNNVGSKWLKLYDEMSKKKVTKDYYSQYFDYIEGNKDSLFDLMFENSPGYEDYRDRMKIDLKNAMNSDLEDLSSNEEFVFYSIITCAMQKVGVK